MLTIKSPFLVAVGIVCVYTSICLYIAHSLEDKASYVPSAEQRNKADDAAGKTSDRIKISALPKQNNGDNQEREGRENGSETYTIPVLNITFKFGESLLILFAILLWLATKRLVTDAKDSSQRQLRAYLSIVPGEVIWQNERNMDPFEFHPFMINDGQTPAHDVTYNAAVELLPFPLPADFNFPLPPLAYPSVSVIGPHQNKFMIIPALRRFTMNELHEILLHGSMRLYVYGTVTYRDVFTEVWYSNFCFTFNWGSLGSPVHMTSHVHNDAN